MNNCATCKHYETESRYEKYESDEVCATGFGLCKRIQHGNGGVGLTSIFKKLDDELRKLREHEKAAVDDGSGYCAALRVKPDFGCVLHEEKAT